MSRSLHSPTRHVGLSAAEALKGGLPIDQLDVFILAQVAGRDVSVLDDFEGATKVMIAYMTQEIQREPLVAHTWFHGRLAGYKPAHRLMIAFGRDFMPAAEWEALFQGLVRAAAVEGFEADTTPPAGSA